MENKIPGHTYYISEYSPRGWRYSGRQSLWFLSKTGYDFPGNKSEFAGTNCQEVLRVLIDRVKYLNGQKPHWVNPCIIFCLRLSLWLFEYRAAARVNEIFWCKLGDIELIEPNPFNGHLDSHRINFNHLLPL
jgi:hypothetical protein